MARGGFVIDVGFGESAVTSWEWAAALPMHVSVLGVERDEVRLAKAVAEANGRVRFASALESGALVIRAMNVLRGGPIDAAAHQRWGAYLAEGGVLLEGSTDTEGHVACFHVVRRVAQSLHREALVFINDGEHGDGPWRFRDWLPRDLRRSVRPGSAVYGLLEDWAAVYAETEGPQRGLRSAAKLGARRQDLVVVGDAVEWVASMGVGGLSLAATIPTP